MPKHSKTQALALALSFACALATGPAHALDKFKVTGVECEQFWLWKHTPVLHYDIVDERRPDYERTPRDEYFSDAAARTAEYCDRTSARPQDPLAPPRRIRGIWFQSNDAQFRALYDLGRDGLDVSAGVINAIGDRYASEQRDAAQHEAELERIRTREARDRELKAAQQKAQQDQVAAEQDRAAAENAREKLFFDRKDLQLARLGAEVTLANFARIDDVRTNPYHFRKLGVAVVQTRFNKMVDDKVALFGNELAPVLVHMEDVDRFTRSGETVMLAFKVIDRGEVEHSYGSLPEIVVSALKAEPIYGNFIGAYSCPGDDCAHLYDEAPPT